MNQDTKSEIYMLTGKKSFPQNYRDDIFMIWYQAGKPGRAELRNIIQPMIGTSIKPTEMELYGWITKEFAEKAKKLDDEMSTALTEHLVSERVAMLKRHSQMGTKMQQIAMTYLDEHKEDLNANSAVRLLVEGIRIERESAGIPEAISKMTNMTDTELLEELDKIIRKTPAKLEVENE